MRLGVLSEVDDALDLGLANQWRTHPQSSTVSAGEQPQRNYSWIPRHDSHRVVSSVSCINCPSLPSVQKFCCKSPQILMIKLARLILFFSETSTFTMFRL